MNYTGYNGTPYGSAYPPPMQPLISPKEYYEKKAIRRASLAIGLLFVSIALLQYIVGFAIAIVMLMSGANSAEVLNSINDPGSMWVLQIVLSTAMFIVPAIFAAKAAKQKVRNLIPLNKVAPSLFFPLLMVGMGVSALGNYATSLFGATTSFFGTPPAYTDMSSPGGYFGGMLVILGSAFVPALVEEFTCRGVVMGLLRPFGDGFAILISAALFGLMHGNLVQTPFAFIVGLGLGYVTVASNSMWTAVTVHFFNNFFATVLNDLMTGLSPTQMSIINIGYMLVLLTLGLLGTALLVRKRPDAFRLNKSTSVFPEKKRIGIFVKTPLMIVALISFAFAIISAQFIL